MSALEAVAADLLLPVAVLAGAALLGVLVALLVVRSVEAVARRRRFVDPHAIRSRLRLSASCLAAALFIAAALPFAGFEQEVRSVIREVDQVLVLLSASWVVIRVLATSSPRLWDLRCFVRERLVAYVQQHYPQMLPRIRAELVPAANGDGTPGGGE